jgi:SWI/SNF-related matrix-associated actin-dependent regulator of chromatin subfamily A member 5
VQLQTMAPATADFVRVVVPWPAGYSSQLIANAIRAILRPVFQRSIAFTCGARAPLRIVMRPSNGSVGSDCGSDSGSESGSEAPAAAKGKGGPSKRTPRSDSAALAANNAAISEALTAAAPGRRRYLLAQAPLFRQFLGLDVDEPEEELSKSKGKARGKKTPATPSVDATGKKRRMTETEEDKLLLASETAAETTRLSVQPANITGAMRPYQIEGLNFMIGLFERGINGILADEMGLGKTLQTISLLAFLRQFKNITGPHIVIVPKSTLGNWMNEIGRWCPDIRAVRFHGNAEERKRIADEHIVIGKFDVVCTTYETVSQEKNLLTKIHWRYLIIDEAHRIKNENSLLAQVVRLFVTQNRLLITGTPLQNNLHELWALLNFLLPDVFSSAEDFENWFSSVEALPDATSERASPAAATTSAAPMRGEGANDDEIMATVDATVPFSDAVGADVASGPSKADAKDANEAKKVKEEAKGEIVKQLHAILRPFLIRRLKAEVEHSLPPKKETVLFTKLSSMQLELYKNLLKKDIDAINGKGGDRVRLLNILMQLRKTCNHPYLFDGVEDRTLDPFGDHVVTNCGKLSLLDRLLPRLNNDGHRVLIFSQMTRVLDILEDYCTMREYKFCRIDGSTDGELRDSQIVDYNKPGSDKFIFLLSTRAGGLGINLATADTVILYDSDWNAQVDLQAMDRAHRIGQKKVVNVYRLITESSVEERVLRTAMAKLRLDTLVIQQGRLTQQKKNLEKNELLDMIRFGADQFFKSHGDEYKDEDLDVILQRGEAKTNEMNKEIEEKVGATGNLDLLDFKISDPTSGEGPKTGSIFQFEGVDYKELAGEGKEFYLDVGKRSRNKTYDEAAYYRDAMRVGQGPNAADKRAKQRLKYRKEPVMHDFQFYDAARLKETFEEERIAVDKFNKEVEDAVRADKPAPEMPPKGQLLSDEVEAERAKILAEGFSNWTRREFNAFLRGVERHGRQNLEAIAQDIGDTKMVDEVHEYSDAFWKLGPTHLDNWGRVVKSIEEGEQKIARRQEMEKALELKVGRYRDPWKELDVIYTGARSKTFIDEEDRWLVCMTNKLGYGRFEHLKVEVRKAWQFRFNWWIKSRTPIELKRRVDALIRLIEKENEEIAKQEKAERKKRLAAKKRRESAGGSGGASKGTGSGKKRKAGDAQLEQSRMDSFFAPKGKAQRKN